MGARTGDQNAAVAGDRRGTINGKHRLPSSGFLKRCSNRRGRTKASPEPFSFIKVMIGPYLEALIIPPKVRKKFKCLLDRNVCLEDSEMRSYPAKISIFNKVLAFRQGWDRFVSDHCIEYGESVVFNYTGGWKFSVQIYGRSGCERTYFPISCQTNSKRKRDEIESSYGNLPHNESKSLDTSKEDHTSHLEATTGDMPSEIALDFSNTEQPLGGADKPPVAEGKVSLATENGQGLDEPLNLCENVVNQHCATDSTVRHNGEATLLSGSDMEHSTIMDDSSLRFVVNEEGVCFVVEEHVILEQNLSTIIPIEIDDSDMGLEACKETSTDHSPISKRPLYEPQMEQNIAGEQFTRNMEKNTEKPLDSPGCLAVDKSHVVPKAEKAERVDYPVKEPIKSSESYEKTAFVGGNSRHEENMNRFVACKGTVGALANVESVDSIVLSSLSPVKMIVSITITAQPWLELSTALPMKGKKDGGKVVTMRDPCMRTWPVLYFENLKFIGFLGGWSALASANSLQPGDACDLEVMAEPDMILVHVKQRRENTLVPHV